MGNVNEVLQNPPIYSLNYQLRFCSHLFQHQKISWQILPKACRRLQPIQAVVSVCLTVPAEVLLFQNPSVQAAVSLFRQVPAAVPVCQTVPAEARMFQSP